MAYSYDRRHLVARAVDLEGLKKDLYVVDNVVGILEQGQLDSPYHAKRTMERAFKQFSGFGVSLARGLLQTFQASATDRKVLEAASASFSKSRIVLQRGKEVETAHKLIRGWRNFATVARRVLEAGVVHEEGSWTAGSFNLINTGGFPDKAMQDVVKIVEKADRLLRSKGLGKVCYGDVHITNTVRKSTRVLAFYAINTDDLFIRANLKGKQGPALQSVVHELAHRLHFKFLKSKNAEINQIYYKLSGQERDAIQDKENWPSPGDEFTEGRRTFIVDQVVYPNVLLHKKDDPLKKFRAPLSSWVTTKSGASAFVTPYAKTSAQENFAEMVAFYCEDMLPDDQVQMLKQVL